MLCQLIAVIWHEFQYLAVKRCRHLSNNFCCYFFCSRINYEYLFWISFPFTPHMSNDIWIHKKQRIYQQIYCSWNSERNFPQQDACFSFAGWPSSSQRHACWQDQSEMHTTPGTGASSTVTLSLARRCARVSSLLVQPSPSSQPSWASSTTSATPNLGMLLAVLPMAAPA